MYLGFIVAFPMFRIIPDIYLLNKDVLNTRMSDLQKHSFICVLHQANIKLLEARDHTIVTPSAHMLPGIDLMHLINVC